MSLLSQVGQDDFMGLNIPDYLENYNEFINPINEDTIPEVNRKCPRIELIF